MDATSIRAACAADPGSRDRDFARAQGISEVELVAAHVGHGVTRLRRAVEEALTGLEAVGEVMALTRNESAVHEKIGTYRNVQLGAGAGVVLGDGIDLRVFPAHWCHAFAVERPREAGASPRRSLQFFDAAGDAVHKVHLRPSSDLDRYEALVTALAADDQSPALPAVGPIAPPVSGPPASRDELAESWRRLTDTHEFYPMLRRLNLGRLEAVSLVGGEFTEPLDLGGTRALCAEVAASGLPIMVFAGSRGCVQIHSGPIHQLGFMGRWLNVMDEKFHLHLRLDHIAELWAVRKPTKEGHVTSVEAYGADRSLIIQFFGIAHKGLDSTAWRELVGRLPRRPRSDAA